MKMNLFSCEPRQLVAFGNFPAFLIIFIIIGTCIRKISEDARKETAENSEKKITAYF